MPDTWGRTLMKRRAALNAQIEGRSTQTLYDIDFLLGVFDESKMGALRFKLDPNGSFLDNNKLSPTPPWVKARELQHAVNLLETDNKLADAKKWLALLVAPGSSLGGARPKANVKDENGEL